MSVNVAQNIIVDAMVGKISADLAQSATLPLTAQRPVRQVARFIGDEVATLEGFRRGIAGRCPAVRVHWIGSRSVKKTIGRRRDQVESSFEVRCISDSHQTREGRDSLLEVVESIRIQLGSRQFSKEIKPLSCQSITKLRDDETMLAYSMTFMTRHHVDYTIDPGADVMESATGDVHVPNTEDTDGRVYGEVDVPLNQEIA